MPHDPVEPLRRRDPRGAQLSDRDGVEARDLGKQWSHRLDVSIEDGDGGDGAEDDRRGRGREELTAPKTFDEREEREPRYRERRESAEAGERHLGELPPLEPRDRVNPLRARPIVQELPRRSREKTAGEEAKEPPGPSLLEIAEERGRARAGVDRFEDQQRCEPHHPERPSREEEREHGGGRAHRDADTEEFRRDANRSPPPVAERSERLEQPGMEEARRQHGRECEGAHEERSPQRPQSEDVIPVAKAEIERLEQEPERKRPEHHGDEFAPAPGYERIPAADENHRVEHEEVPVPRGQVPDGVPRFEVEDEGPEPETEKNHADDTPGRNARSPTPFRALGRSRRDDGAHRVLLFGNPTRSGSAFNRASSFLMRSVFVRPAFFGSTM